PSAPNDIATTADRRCTRQNASTVRFAVFKSPLCPLHRLKGHAKSIGARIRAYFLTRGGMFGANYSDGIPALSCRPSSCLGFVKHSQPPWFRHYSSNTNVISKKTKQDSKNSLFSAVD